MGRHPCDRCGEEGWDYSETYCPRSDVDDGGLCTYWDGCEICPDCMVLVSCDRCGTEGCDFCVKDHCPSPQPIRKRGHATTAVESVSSKCHSNLCSTCNDHSVAQVAFPSCGHTACNGFVKVGAALDYCQACTTLNTQKEKGSELAVQQQLESDDAIVLKTVQAQFKSESLKKTAANWLAAIINAEPVTKKLKTAHHSHGDDVIVIGSDHDDDDDEEEE
jgi:hypothetical protein